MARFEDSIDYVIQNEGGYVNNPADPGGETRYGISKRAYPTLDIRNLTLDQAKAIYRRDFWKFDGLTSQAVATKIFDMYVLAKHNAIRQVQAIVGVTQDGFWGANTEHEVNLMDEVKFITYFRQWMVNYYIDVVKKNPAEGVFLTGWLRRARQ